MKTEETFDAWITKYVLTDGIVRKNVVDLGDGRAKESGWYLPNFFHKKE